MMDRKSGADCRHKALFRSSMERADPSLLHSSSGTC